MTSRDVAVRNSKDLSIFSNVTKSYYDFARKKLTGYKFTPNEISTMIYLLENDDIDTAKGISERFGVTQSLICRSVDSLTRRGYIISEIDSADRRINHLTLHISDRKLLDILKSINTDYMDHILSSVSPDDASVFKKVLESIEHNVR